MVPKLPVPVSVLIELWLGSLLLYYMPFSFLISQCLASAAPHRGVRFSSPAGFQSDSSRIPATTTTFAANSASAVLPTLPRATARGHYQPRRAAPGLANYALTYLRAPQRTWALCLPLRGSPTCRSRSLPVQPAPISRGSGVSPPVVAAPRFPSRSPWRGATSVPLAVQISLQLLVGLVTTVATLRVVGPETNVSLSRRGGIHPTATSARCSWPPRCFYVPIALICFGWLQLHPLACCSFSPVS